MNKSLISLDLKCVYDSSENHLINDLIVPLLSHSIEYWRGVGYFSSGWLRLASIGISELISSGGFAKLIMSPILAEDDWKSIIKGNQARKNEALKHCLRKSIDNITESLENETLNAFAWLIADELLEIRFAVPKEEYREGDYHDKVAFFKDIQNNYVAIHGSFNDSIQGTLNGEAFSVFRSWETSHKMYVEKHVVRLKELWENKNKQFYAYELPKAIKEQIVKLRTTSNRPYDSPVRKDTNIIQPEKKIVLRDYQKDAIQAWVKDDCQGIFEMATGSGKTYAALGAAKRVMKEKKNLCIIILVPYIHLLDQWKKDCQDFGFHPILCGSSNHNWKKQLRSAVYDFRITGRNLCVIAVHQTSSQKTFLRAFDNINEFNKMLIADEVHGLGACQLRKSLQNNIHLRLGLSATPKRWYDNEGTKIIFDYFKNVSYEFTLEDGIENDFLVPYRYEPQLITLCDDEKELIKKYNNTIVKLYSKREQSDFDEIQQLNLERSFRERALIVKKARNKFPSLERLISSLRKHGKFSHAIFYSPETKYKEVLSILKKHHVFANQFIGEDSAIKRKMILKNFEKGHIEALVAMKCLDEGIDVPSTRIAFFISSTTNPKEFIQRRGRVLRKADNKIEAIIYDFIVIPDENTDLSVARYLIEREMPRFAEFSDLSSNKYDARSKIKHILYHFEMVQYFEMKPWDVYHKQDPLSHTE